MNYKWLFFVATASVLCGFLLLGLSTQKQITLIIDGRESQLRVSALTVASLLNQKKISLYEGDRIQPSPQVFLSDGQKVTIQRSARVTIQANGTSKTLTSIEKIPANLLAQAKLPLFPGDKIVVNGRLVEPNQLISPASAYDVQVLRAWPITLNTEGQQFTFTSSAPTLGEALWEVGIVIGEADRLTPPAETPLQGPINAQLNKAKDLEIRLKGRIIQTRSSADTVGIALAEANVPLEGSDYSLPDPEAPLPKNGKIQVVRVQDSILLETEPLSFGSETQPDPNLELDNKKVIKPGVFGLKARKIRIRSEDGVEISRQVEDEYTAQEPQPEIVGYGTKIVPHNIKTGGGSIKYWRALNMYAVSYNPTSNGGYGTATGMTLAKGIAAVDIHYIPFGTRMYIPGYGEAIAADTGGGVIGRMIDLGYGDDDYQSWHQWVTVYFLWPPPENVVWMIP